MPKIIQQDNGWDFVPTLKPLAPTDNPAAFAGVYGVYREDSPHPLGIVTKRYRIVTNGELVERARNVLKKLGFSTWEENLISIDGGARFMGQFSIRDRLVPKSVGDTVGYRISLINSFDTSTKASAFGGFLRLVCSNGMASLEDSIALSGRHDANIDLNKIEAAIERVVNGLDGQATIFTRFMERAISNEQGNVILKNLVLRKAISERIRESIQSEWENPRFDEDKERNLYNLYNAATYILTHQIATQRAELASNINAAILMLLRDAVMAKEKMEMLLTAPVEKTQVTVTVVKP